ncbi:MAG TPA: hypothetical protein PKA64_12805, partial [Myxococcota bacterium]|nr:hypothetical protein [Myxococcota bacterium]
MDLGRLLIAGAVLAGCATSPPAPEILRVSPDWAFNGDVTNVEIAGRNLYPNVRISASGARDEATPEGYGIRLLPTSGGDPLVLDGARLVEVDALQVVVPPDEPVGVYDLELTTPFGGVAVLTEGFRVVDTRADAFSVELDSVQWQVGEQVSFDVGVVDRAGEPIVDGRLVEIVLESRTGRPVEATFDPVGLDGWSELGDAVGVVGGLGADGVASVRLTVTRPDRLRIRARSVADDPDALRDEAVNVEVTSGEVDAIRVTVDPGLTVVAGQPVQARVEFVDAGGNVVPDASLTVALSTSCGEVGPVVADVDEAVTMIITPTRATGTFVCPEMRLIANGGGGIVGQSDPIVVQAGAVVDLDVSVASGALRAGENVPVVVFGQDAYGNLARWRDVVAAARDPGGDVFGFSCTASVPSLCTVVTTRASPSTWLEFEDAAGVVGRSQPFALAPASAAKVRFDLPIQWTAGEVEPVTLTLLDPWDNHVAPAAVLPESAVFQVSVGSVSCTPSLVQPADALAYSCVAFVATPQAELGVSLPGLAITGQSPSFRVDNGPLGSLGVSIGASLVEAGQPLVVNVSAVDAYGNPLIVQADPRLVIVDPDGILSPDEVRLDASGQSQFALRRRRSGRGVTFQITGEGGVRATSPPFDVVAGPPVSLSVTPAAPWVTVGDPLSVVVQVYDELGNRSETSGVVTLESRGNPRDVATCFLVNGTCDAVFTWTQPSAGDRIDVEVLVGGAVGTATGSSDEVLVLAECGDSPRVALSFGGRAEGIACAAPAGPTTIRGALAVTPAVG